MNPWALRLAPARANQLRRRCDKRRQDRDLEDLARWRRHGAGGRERCWWPFSIRTQRPTRSGGFVDIEITSSRGRPTSVLWIEVKHQSQPTAGQLANYQDDILAVHGGAYLLCLLVPRGAATVDMDVRRLEWQDFAKWLRKWSAGRRAKLRDADYWLTREFVHFLREEGLEEADGLRAIHLVTLNHATESYGLLGRLRDGIEAQLAALGWEFPNSGPVDKGRRWYLHARRSGVIADAWNTTWRGGWLELKLMRDANRSDPRGEIVFGAGFTSRPRRHPSGSAANKWRARLEQAGFELVTDDQWRLYRFKYLDELLGLRSVEEQAEVVGQWVHDTFQQLILDPLPETDDLEE